MVNVAGVNIELSGRKSKTTAPEAELQRRIRDIRFMTQKFFPTFAHNVVDDYKHRILTAATSGHPLTREGMVAMAANLMRDVYNQGNAVLKAKSPQSELINQLNAGHSAVTIAAAIVTEIGFAGFGLAQLIGLNLLLAPAATLQAGAMTYLAKKSKGGEKLAYLVIAGLMAASVGGLGAMSKGVAPVVQNMISSEDKVAKDLVIQRDKDKAEEARISKILADGDKSVETARVTDQKVLGSGASSAELNKATSLTRTLAANKALHAQYDEQLKAVQSNVIKVEAEIREKMADDPSRLYAILALMSLFSGGMLTSTLVLSKALSAREKLHEESLKAAAAVEGIKSDNKDLEISADARKGDAALVLLGLQNAYALSLASNVVRERLTQGKLAKELDVDSILKETQATIKAAFPDIDVMSTEVADRFGKMIDKTSPNQTTTKDQATAASGGAVIPTIGPRGRGNIVSAPQFA